MSVHRKQFTTTYRSTTGASNEENFRAYLATFRAVKQGETPKIGFLFDEKLCKVPRQHAFEFSVRSTRSTVGTLIHAKTTPHSLAVTTDASVKPGAFIQATLLMKGSVYVTLNDSTTLVSAGSLIIKDPSAPFLWTVKEACEYFSLIVPADYFFAHTNVPLRTFLSQVLTLEKPEGRLLRNVMMLTNQTLETLDPRDAGDACDGMLCFMRPLLMSHFRSRQHEQRMSNHERIRGEALNVMQKWMRRPSVTVKMIAEACGVSPRVLTSVFREVGDSPAARLLRLRLEHAKVYLTEEHTKPLSIETIALNCGFRSNAHFSRAFKAFYGISPREMKNKNVLD